MSQPSSETEDSALISSFAHTLILPHKGTLSYLPAPSLPSTIRNYYRTQTHPECHAREQVTSDKGN